MQVNPVQRMRALIGLLLFLLLIPFVLFVSAGTLDWPMAWLYVAFFLLASLLSRLVVYRRDPEALHERAKFTSAEGVPAWDRILVLIVGLVSPMLLALIAGLDHRFEWSPTIQPWLVVGGTLLVASGYLLAVWAMIENRYFSSVVRIQTDRDHTVISEGAYRFVRHPGYAGSLLSTLGFPLMLSALWAYLPGAAYIAAIVLRTYLEDRLLLKKLSGYGEYAGKVSHRLIPFVW
ncbi:MAG: isoprenylcysteine carboxylmethyltransferase family protein [Anaerolineales bacterium]|nr:isoprenylcysteine carboxylmethyltransferase family protein [Anaerolineales bacterium]